MTTPPTEEGQDHPIAVEPKTRLIMPLAFIGTIVAATAAGTLAWSTHSAQINENTASVKRHEARIESLENSTGKIDRMANDIDWIKQTMMEDRRRAR